MKKLLSGVMLISAAMFCAGCAKTALPSQNQKAAQSIEASPNVAAGDKVGTTVKSGTVTKVGNSYLLRSGNQSIGIDSYSIDLSQYVGQQITVSGEYSGDTLFVTSVK